MFDKAILPILFYGSEVRGFEFVTLFLKLKKVYSIFFIYGELGRYSISMSAKVRMINFWCKLVKGKENKISYIL